MLWKKLGLLYSPTSVHAKLWSHAANPLAIWLEGNIFRVFYSGRDLNSRSSVGYVDVDIEKLKVVYVHNRPIFEHGSAGTFYSDGISIGNCYENSGLTYMLFMGWQRPANQHWRGDIGRFVLKDKAELMLVEDRPFLACDGIDKISLSYPWVLRDRSGTLRMWYGSTISWDQGDEEMVHVINQARSSDGARWRREGLAIPFVKGLAQAFSRPTVSVRKDGSYDMWFSYRSGTGESYRIGHARSDDGIQWELNLINPGINVASTGWDSEMIEYPFVFEHANNKYMLYNGNGFGRTGFGLAILWQEN